MKKPAKKYKYDKALSLFYTTSKHLSYSHPDWILHYFETDEEAKEFAINLIKSEGYEDYEVSEERFLENLPNLQQGLKLYEVRIVK